MRESSSGRRLSAQRSAGLQRLPPGTVVPVPLHNIRQALLERHERLVVGAACI
jgi:hypothetical protein